MSIHFKLMICLVWLLSSISCGINFVRISENKNLAVYIDVDSVAKEGWHITANQIKEYQTPMLTTAIQPNTPTTDVRDFLFSKNAPK